MRSSNRKQERWWQRAVVYEIYPRSFSDSNGDGIGDLQGIVDRLDYLNDGTSNSLGIDAIWLTPIYPSPGYDFGYDVKDYCDVDPLFGNLEDFDQLLLECHKRNIKVIMDLILNHTSHKHPWFLESRASKESNKRDWYIWRDGKDGKLPNNWNSIFGGSAWEWDNTTEQYYYHMFLKEQPDLNWRNPEVLKAMTEVMRFWLDRGVDGFRLDAVNTLFEDEKLRDNPSVRGISKDKMRPHEQQNLYNWNQPETHKILKKVRDVVNEYPDRMMVGEVYVFDLEGAASYYGNDDELHLVFNFDFCTNNWSALEFRNSINIWEGALSENSWPVYFLSNHDYPRHYSKYGNSDSRARIAAALLLTLRGTPFFYYGEEIGMKDVPIRHEDMQDPFGIRYPKFCRDPARTPMQWSNEKNSDFSKGKPWLPLSPDFGKRNVKVELKDPDSVLNLYKSLIQLRKSRPTLSYGGYRCISEDPECFVFLREYDKDRILVALNFSSKNRSVFLDGTYKRRTLLSTHRKKGDVKLGRDIKLDSYEAYIAEVINTE